jgi:hypothetical protein
MAAGIAASVAAWLKLVPWDLSEIDALGRPSPGSADANAPAIAAVIGIVLVVGVLLAILLPKGSWGFAVGGSIAWAALFAWRAAVGRAVGVNLWPVSFVMFILPAVAFVVLLVRAVARWRLGLSPFGGPSLSPH